VSGTSPSLPRVPLQVPVARDWMWSDARQPMGGFSQSVATRFFSLMARGAAKRCRTTVWETALAGPFPNGPYGFGGLSCQARGVRRGSTPRLEVSATFEMKLPCEVWSHGVGSFTVALADRINL